MVDGRPGAMDVRAPVPHVLRVRPGPAIRATGWRSSRSSSSDGRFVATWTPGEPGMVWAALDCPTSAPVMNADKDPPIVLARLAAAVDAGAGAGRAARARVVGARPRRAQARGRVRAVRRGRPRARALARAVDRVTSGVKGRGVGSSTVEAAMSTHFRTCPFCEATCGLEVTMDGTRGGGGPRRRGGRVQPRLHLSEGDRAQAPAQRTATGCAHRSSSRPTAASPRPPGTRP